jgi:hypothetical protein
VTVDVASARRDWEDGHRRLLELVRDAGRAEPLHAQVDAVTAELRKRVGATFTLHELASAYADADRWAREAVAERAPSRGWPATLSVATDAAFHLYARGASDYRP